jgi:hypothetical protein
MSKSKKSTASPSKAKLSIAALKGLKARAASNYAIAFSSALEPVPNSPYTAGNDVVMRCTGFIVLTSSAQASQFSLSLLSSDGSATPKGAAGNIVLTLQPGATEQFDFRVVHQAAAAGRYTVEALLVPQSDPAGAISQTSDYVVT